MREHPWPATAATGIGSMPGTDPAEAAAIVFDELPEFPYVPELPARSAGSGVIGRTAAMLVDLVVEVVPTGYRVSSRPGKDHRRAVDLLAQDLDAVQQVAEATKPEIIKTQLAGPWTLTAGIELARGQRVFTDNGARREFADSLVEGARAHITELAARTGATVVVQLDEPTLPDVLAGSLPTPSGYGTVPAVHEADAHQVLASVVERLEQSSGAPVVLHCCASRPPVGLLRATGAGGLALDATLLEDAPSGLLDELGEAWDAGLALFLGLLPGVDPGAELSLREAAEPALRLVDRLGLNRAILRDRAVATLACGLAGASHAWMRRALALIRDLGNAFADPPDDW